MVQPLADIGKLLSDSAKLTRLVMRISPAEMDRDPVFAFNAALPDVLPTRELQVNVVCPQGWSEGPQAARLSMNGLGSWVFKGLNSLDPRFKKAPAALTISLLDETGPALLLAPEAIAVVDQAILGAKPGKASLPDGLAVKKGTAWVPPASDVLVTTLGPWLQPPGCKPKSGWQNGQLPPTSTSVGSDANGSDGSLSDVVSGADVSGPVPGIDAAGGWNTDAVGPELQGDVAKTAPPAAPKSAPDNGCAATRTGAAPGWAVVGLVLAALMWRRRRSREGGESCASI